MDRKKLTHYKYVFFLSKYSFYFFTLNINSDCLNFLME